MTSFSYDFYLKISKQVERALGFHKYGSQPVEDDKISFSGDNFSQRTKLFVAIAKKMSAPQWKKVIDGANGFTSKYKTSRSRSASPACFQGDDDDDTMDVDMAALDEDSDLDA